MSDFLFFDISVFVEYFVDGEKVGIVEEILLGFWVFLMFFIVYREVIGVLVFIIGREKFGIKGKYSLRKFVV